MTQQEYDDEVRSIARNVKDENPSDPYDAIFEAVDSHQWIIYTAYYLDVLEHASEPNYAVEQGLITDANALIAEGGVDRLHQVLAFYALEHDVTVAYDELEDDDCDEDEARVSAAEASETGGW